MDGEDEFCKSSCNKWNPFLYGNPFWFCNTTAVQKNGEKSKLNEKWKAKVKQCTRKNKS